MAVFTKNFVQDLKGCMDVHITEDLVFSADNDSNVVSVELYNGDEAATLTGSVVVYVIRADGNTVVFNGTLSGNTVSAVLPQSCFVIPGPVAVMLQIVSGDVKTTVLKAIFTAVASSMGAIIDPGHVIPDISDIIAMLDDLEEAIANAQAATAYIAPTETSPAESAHAVGEYLIYNGALYEVTAAISVGETLRIGTNIAAAPAGLGGEVTDLKSAVGDLSALTTQDKSSLVAAINEAAVSGGGGLTDAVKSALLQIFTKVAYVDEHGQDYYYDLYDALYSVTAVLLNSNSIMLNTLGATSQLTARTIPEGGQITWTSSNPTVATVDQTGLVTSVAYGNATITATSGTATDTCSVVVFQVTLSGITAEYTPSGKVYETDALDTLKSDLVVTAVWSDGSRTVVPSADYTLSGTLSTGSSVITASYGGKTASFTVTVVGLTSISATYTQSGTVYSDDPLDSLKPDLVVLKNYSDSSAQATTDYTLSGTLETGTSTITVTCAGFTDTFTVTVTSSPVLYRLPQETTFNGSSDYIDTGVQLHKTDMDFTVMMDVSVPSNPGNQATIMHCMHEVSPYYGTAVMFGQINDGISGVRPMIANRNQKVGLSPSATYPMEMKIIITHAAGNNYIKVYRVINNVFEQYKMEFTFTSIDETILLGAYQDTSGSKARWFSGTIRYFVVRGEVIPQTSIDRYLGIADSPVTSLTASPIENLYAGGNPEYWVKPYLTVYAVHDNGINERVRDFTITPDMPLVVGDNTLTVSRAGLSTTVTVTAVADTALYRISQDTVFDGVDDYIDTGVQLCSTNHAFIIAMVIDGQSQPDASISHLSTIVCCGYDRTDSTIGTAIDAYSGSNPYIRFSFANRRPNIAYSLESIDRIVCIYDGSRIFIYARAKDGTHPSSISPIAGFTPTTSTTIIGGYQDSGSAITQFFKGTIHDLAIIDGKWTGAQINAYLGK